MFDWNGKGLSIGDLKMRTPIVQGGMGIGVSGAKLAAAVANEGGLGVLSGVGMSKLGLNSEKTLRIGNESISCSVLRQEIQKARSMTSGALGVNIMVAVSDFGELAKTSIEAGIDVIFAGAGLPLNLPSFLTEGCKTKLVPIVSSAKAAMLIAKRWMTKYSYVPDAFVVEGPMAGGHLGFSKQQIDDPAYRLENLVTEVLVEVRKIEEATSKKIPVIAAGGIYTGEDIYNMLQLGASGVQMATRFVATYECDAGIEFKNAYVNCKKEDIGIIESPVGLPGRALINDFLIEAKKGNRRPKTCASHCITTCKEQESPYCITGALVNAFRGNFDKGFAFIGANGYRIDKIVSVNELFRTLEDEFKERAKR